jgi:endonuclease G
VRIHAAKWLEDPNVTSIGIGYKQVKDKVTPEISIQFTVGTKTSPEHLESLSTTRIPESIEIDGTSIPTDVIERSFSPSFKRLQLLPKDQRSARVETLQPGISVGSVNTSAGTIGAFVRDRRSGKIVLLSNWHVLQGPTGTIGDDIVQPGRHDDNRIDENVIGKLLRSHLGAAGDCAIASISRRPYIGEVLGLGVVVGTIGDPALGDHVIKSGRTTGVTRGIVTRLEVNTKMDYGKNTVAAVGGFEIGPDPATPAPDGEISRAGDSGSTWLATDKKGNSTSTMLGLHFAGDSEGTVAEFALACYGKSIMTALEIEPVSKMPSVQIQAEDDSILRTGFDREFLSFFINVPTFVKSRMDDLASLEEKIEIPYCHFSTWLSKQRKYPLCVAWNIDGSQFNRLKRVSFRTDRRGNLEEFQLTNDIYANNPFDKGHIARRADLCWGNPQEARQGNYDSFYYTNIAPQHEAFNQSDNTDADPDGGIWGRLENTLLDTEHPHQLRISLIAGPVFGPKDRWFEQVNERCLIPDNFWKVVAYTDDTDQKEKVYAFLLTQPALIKDLTIPQGLDLEPWLWARITLQDLEAMTGVRFPKALHTREMSFVAPQSLETGLAIKLLMSPDEYFKA